MAQNLKEYIKNNLKESPARLLLRDSDKIHDFPVEFAVTQIECRQKTARKLSSFIANEDFMFPSVLASEQATHQCVAKYHASLVGKDKNICDITAGLGIDAITLSKAGNRVTAIELDEKRAEILQKNTEVLDASVKVINDDCFNVLKSSDANCHFDILFADPARRDANLKRTYFLRDCLPDVIDNFNILARFADIIMIKASPIIDISAVIKEVPRVRELHVVSVEGECKEVLIISQPGTTGKEIGITVIDLKETADGTPEIKSCVKTNVSELGSRCVIVATDDIEAGNYIYDPNSGLHKLNCGKILCDQFAGLKKLSANTDLYISDRYIPDFPGRIFKINSLPDRNILKKLEKTRCEVITRNYPLTPDQLRKKLRILSGGERYIIGVRTGQNEKPILLDCSKQS